MAQSYKAILISSKAKKNGFSFYLWKQRNIFQLNIICPNGDILSNDYHDKTKAMRAFNYFIKKI